MTPVIAAYAEEPLHATSSLASPPPLKKREKKKQEGERGAATGSTPAAAQRPSFPSLLFALPVRLEGSWRWTEGGEGSRAASPSSFR